MIHNSNEPKRNLEQIKRSLKKCGFDPNITVNVWEESQDGWRWTGKTGLAIAIYSCEWNQANLGKRFPNSIYEVRGRYVFPTGMNINEQEPSSVLVANKPITKPCNYYKPTFCGNRDLILRSLKSQ